MKRKKSGFTPLETKVSNRGSKRFLTGFTLVEMLMVLGIIVLLVGLLIPALSMVRNTARETKQKAQLTTISLALMAFKNDYGDYPPSYWTPGSDYCGAQKLAEALLGWDLLGFHPKSAWRADGYDGLTPNGPWTYDPDEVRGDDTLYERKGPYLELATTNAFRLGNNSLRQDPEGLFNDPAPLDPDTFVLCDVFGIPERRITLANGKTVTPGTPILYYRANTSSKKMIDHPLEFDSNIYNIHDNGLLVSRGKMGDVTMPHPLWNSDVFYSANGGVVDPKVTAIDWPYRPDSYILISAGADGLYGTGDDITNFGN